MQKAAIGIVIVLWTTHMACAEGLKLVGENVTWQTGKQSQPYTIRVASTTEDVVALACWQLRLQIIPKPDAIDEISFASTPVALSAPFRLVEPFTDPTPPSSPQTSGLVVAYLDESDASHVDISSAATDLLRIELKVSAETRGHFDIAVVPSSESGDYYGAEWCFDDNEYLPQPFDGAPFSSDKSAKIGSVIIRSVPEPSGISLVFSGLAMMAIVGLAAHGRQTGMFFGK